MGEQEDWKKPRIPYLPNFHPSDLPTHLGIKNTILILELA